MKPNFFSSHRFLIVLAFLALGIVFTMPGYASEQKTENPPKSDSSLSRTFKLIDENGKEVGTLVMDPQGGAILRDTDGKIMGEYTKNEPAQIQTGEPKSKEPEKQLESQPVQPESETQGQTTETGSAEVKSEDQEKTGETEPEEEETGETEPGEEKPEA